MRGRVPSTLEFGAAYDSCDDSLFEQLERDFMNEQAFLNVKSKDLGEITLDDVFALMDIYDPEVSDFIDHIFRYNPALYNKFVEAMDEAEAQQDKAQAMHDVAANTGNLGVPPVNN